MTELREEPDVVRDSEETGTETARGCVFRDASTDKDLCAVDGASALGKGPLRVVAGAGVVGAVLAVVVGGITEAEEEAADGGGCAEGSEERVEADHGRRRIFIWVEAESKSDGD